MNGGSIFLVGFMGAGKTTVGALLATRVGLPFIDTDAEIEKQEGRTIDAIFESDGEGYFRGLEAEIIRRLERGPRAVVATGGGVFLSAALRRLLHRRGTTVWLDLPLAEARNRLAVDDTRPLWLPDNLLEFRAFFEKRRGVYALASHRLDAGRWTAMELAAKIAERLDLPDRKA